MIEEDIKILMELFRMLENNIEGAKFYQPVDLLNEFAYTIREELDYVMEGQQADRVRKNFEKVDGIYVPKIYWEWSNRDMLVMEEIKGIKVNDLAGIEKNGYNRSAVARKATRLILKSILVDGFFHADPHPGNIFIMEGESIGIIDFGMMGRLSHGDRGSFVSLMQAYVNRNAEDLVEQLLQLAPVEDVRYLDQQVFTRDLERVLSRYYDLSLQEVSFTNVINDSFDIIHKYRLKLPTRYFLLFKSLIILDGIGRELDSKFNILDEVKPFVKEQMSFYNLFPEIRNEFLKNILNLNQFAKDFPKAIKEILRQIREGDFRVDIRHEGLKDAIGELDVLANRVSLAMIISALIMGVSLLLQVYKPIHQMEVLFSWVLTILIVVTVTLLFWLLYDLFIKSRRW
jgi:ubiquinone biosynthesis protein